MSMSMSCDGTSYSEGPSFEVRESQGCLGPATGRLETIVTRVDCQGYSSDMPRALAAKAAT